MSIQDGNYSIVLDDAVAASDNDVWISSTITNAYKPVIRKFGGVTNDPKSYIVLQAEYGGSWHTVRAGSGMFDFNLNKQFQNTAGIRFRIVRQNNGAVNAILFAWLEGYVIDA